MMKKNVLAMGLALTMALGLTACGSSSNGSASSGAASGSASQNDASASAPAVDKLVLGCLLYTSPSPRDYAASRMPSSA